MTVQNDVTFDQGSGMLILTSKPLFDKHKYKANILFIKRTIVEMSS